MMNLEGLVICGLMPPLSTNRAQGASHAIQEPSAGASLRRFGDEFDNEVHGSCLGCTNRFGGQEPTLHGVLRGLRIQPVG